MRVRVQVEIIWKEEISVEISIKEIKRQKRIKQEKVWKQRCRYVNGVKVSIKEGEEEYYKLLEQERMKNKRLGYGNDERNWELKKYENERRNLKKLERIKKLYGV